MNKKIVVKIKVNTEMQRYRETLKEIHDLLDMSLGVESYKIIEEKKKNE